jgi:hypothetical protein
VLNSVHEGAEELLTETIKALNESSVQDYIVIGGWCPYIRNTSGIRHPGTLDVDILFKDGGMPGSLKPAIEALKNCGFILSAQLLKEKNIRGERLIYNVDLLHPSMNESYPDLFVDHMELDVPLDDEERRMKKTTSIVMPNSSILFDKKLYSKTPRNGIEFDLMNFTGMLITKMDSCQKQKRERDAFDLYIALKSRGIDFSLLKQIRSTNSRVEKSLANLSKYLESKNEIFTKRRPPEGGGFPVGGLNRRPPFRLKSAISFSD